MKNISIVIIIVLAFSVQAKYSMSSLTAKHSNQGYITDYLFSFSPLYSYEWGTARIDFPIEYSLSNFTDTLECWISSSGIVSDYNRASCWIEPSISLASYFVVGSVHVQLVQVVSAKPYFILLRNVVNPVNRDLTSFFAVCIEVQNTQIECDKGFARLLLNNGSIINTQTSSFKTSPPTLVVGQGTTYIFTMNVSPFGSWYSSKQLISIRVIFPQGFETYIPTCSIAYSLSAFQKTYVPTATSAFQGRPNIIQCQKISDIQKYLSNGAISFKIQTVINPLSAKLWTGISFQIVRSIHNELLQVVTLTSPINIQVESFIGSTRQTNNFRNATTLYYLYLNHDVLLSNSSTLTITIGNGSLWKIHSVKLFGGFTSPGTVLTSINNGVSNSSVLLSNYGIASRLVQQYIGINLTSSIIVGDHLISVRAQIKGNDVGYWAGSLYINQTYGQFNFLSLSAVRQKRRLGVNSTGSLELRFFLNYLLPQSQGLKNGSLQVSIYPQLTAPNPNVNGVLKCYFKGIYQASNCTLNNTDPNKSLINIVSPPLQSFQYSQVPILITTEGAVNQSQQGFPINPVVTRYRFEVAFYLYNSSSTPSQVYYGEWIANATEIKIVSANSLTYQCLQWTKVQINLIMPFLSTVQPSAELRIMVHFISHPVTKINGWDYALGYKKDKIYKQHPCIVSGLVGNNIKCDLYTYTGNSSIQPYNNLHFDSDFTGPFFIIYGFENSGITGANVTIQIPKIRIGSIHNVPAMIKVSILQETPAMLDPYIELYFKNMTVFTTKPDISILQTVVPSSQLFPLPVQTYQQYNVTWNIANSSFVKYIKYQINQPYFPAFKTASSACLSSCMSFSLPANWIVQMLSSPAVNPYSTNTISTLIKTISFTKSKDTTYPIHISTFDSSGNTLGKYFMDYHYTPQKMVAYFDFKESVCYAGLPQWYSISFVNAPVVTSTYPFVRLLLDNNLKFASPIQCDSTTILPFNSSELLFKLQSSNSLLVYNIKQILPSSTYRIDCRLQTVSSKFSTAISPQVNIELHHNYSIGDSYTAVVDNVTLQQAPIFPNKAKPLQFQIHNPQILNQEPRINYVGPLFLDFTSSTNTTYDNLKIILNNHRYNKAGWTTPSGTNSDPPVCFLNSKRYSCSWTNNPLTINLDNPAVIIGLNKLQLSSEYVAPYNGVKFPGSAGQYSIVFEFTNTSSITVGTLSFFAKILPHDLLHMQASSIVKDIGTQSVYHINFTIPTWATFPNAYNHPFNYSRIFVQFPTTLNNLSLFSGNLGGYKGEVNQRVGCSFVLGMPYITSIAGKQLECRFIPAQFIGGKVRVEIINHNGFTAAINSASFYIFKVFNPSIAYSSFDIRVIISHYQVSTRFIYPIYQGKYTIFLDPYSKNTAPIETLTIDNEMLVNFFNPLLKVGSYGEISLTAQSLTTNYLQDPYYVIFKLPAYLPPQNNQVSTPFKSCPAANFQLCITSPEIQYVLVKARSSPSSLQVYIRNYPAWISQTDSLFYGEVIEQGRYVGKIVYNITGDYKWKQIQGSLTFNYAKAEGSALKLDLGKKQAQILVAFTTQHQIPAYGTIQIVFPSTITKIYPNCRSATGQGSLLYSAAGVGALGRSGQIGCSIQHNNHWVITSFEAVGANQLIVIRGYIDLPAVTGSIGIGQIITYADQSQTDIYLNGSRIDYVQTDLGLAVSSTQAMNANEDIFLTQRQVLRKAYVGQFRFIFTLASPLNLQEFIEVSLYKQDIKASNNGFSLTNRPKVCEFVRIDTEDKIGCYVDLETETFIYQHEVVMFHLKSVENLLSSVVYQVRLTSQDYNIPEGINYPVLPGTYKIDILTNHTLTNTVEMQQKYIQVVGPSFSKLIITQFNFLAGYYSPFWVQLSPTEPILQTHQIILQFPTISNDGVTRLFLDDLGWSSSISNGQGVPVDMFDCIYNNTFMNCRIFFGSSTEGRPAKIICGNLQSSILIGQTLKFAFAMTNPSPLTVTTLSQLSIPIFVYSYDPTLYQKINFNTVNVGAVINNGNNTAIPNPYFATKTNQLQTKNQSLSLSRYNSKAFVKGDFYVVKFNFPLRMNIMDTLLGCRDNAGALIGTIYYHQNLRTVVCALSVPLGANPLPTFANLVLNNFYTPWYLLTSPERQVYGIASYQLQTQSQFIEYFDPFPLLGFRTSGFTTPYFMLTPLMGHYTACQQQDYIITVRLQNNPSANFDLSYTKMILINMPDTGTSDFQVAGTDCMQHSTSTIQIISCRLDQPSRTIIVVIEPGTYQNGNTLAIVTRGLAIKNPCYATWIFSFPTYQIRYWNIYYLSFENGTALTPSTSYAYLALNSLNILSGSLTIQYENTVSSSYKYPPFSWFQIPYERYYNQFLQYDANQYSPFSFEFKLSTTIPALSWNRLSINLEGNYLPCGSQYYIDDLSIFTPICYLANTRIQRCYIDIANNITYMEFNFSLTANTVFHAYFSVIDPRNPQLDGYSYIGSEDVTKLSITLDSGTNTYNFQTYPFEAFESQFGTVSTLPVRGITLGTIDYANCIGGQLNILDMTLTVSRTDITALRIQIPMVDQFGNQIFGPSYKNSFFNLQNGDEYPCGNNQIGITQTGSHKCYLFYGSYNTAGSPVHIIMTDFNSGSNIKVRILLKNPTNWGSWLSVYVKAYTGIQNQYSLYGANFAGFWNFPNIFQITSNVIYGGSSEGRTCCYNNHFLPSNYVWRQSTTFTAYTYIPYYPSWVYSGDYLILEVLLYQYSTGTSDDQICTVNFAYYSNTNTDDVIILKNKQAKYEKAYFIKKSTGASWPIEYFKCKHYLNTFNLQYNPTSKTVVSIIRYTLSGWYTYSIASGPSSSFNYIHIFPLNKKSYLQLDLTGQVNYLLSTNFIWDNNVKYNLVVSTSPFCPSITKCVVVQGLESSDMKMPISCAQSGCGVIIRGFTKILFNTRVSRYRVKVQMQHSPYYTITWTPVYYSLTANMYAHQSAQGGSWNDWFVFTSVRDCPNLFQGYAANYPSWPYCFRCHTPVFTNYYYSHYQPYSPSTDFTVNIYNIGMNAAQTTLQLRFSLTPKHTISMSSGGTYTDSFPQFRFIVNNYPFYLSTITKFIITLNRAGWPSYPIDFTLNPGSMIRCERMSEILVNFYYWKQNAQWGQIWNGGVEGASWTTDSTLEFDMQFFITGQLQALYYRDWITITSFVELFEYSGVIIQTSCGLATRLACLYEANSTLSYEVFSVYQHTVAFSQNQWVPIQLFNSIALQPLSNNINEPTEMSIVFSNALIAFGPTSYGKLLLVQIDQDFNPFATYTNSTSLLSQIQCKCKTTGLVVDQKCYFRPNAINNQRSAFTVDIQLTYWQSATCYFPQWKVTTAGSYSVTAKLINDYGGFPSLYSSLTLNGGGYYQTTSSSFAFVSSPPLTATITQSSSPSIYSPTSQVNTFQNDYDLSLTIPIATAQPFVYINFQKGGIIPDSNLCTNTFFLTCRIYKTSIHVMVAQFKQSTSPGGTLLFNSNFAYKTYLPKHWQYGVDSDYAVTGRVLATSSDSSFSYKAVLSRTALNLLPTPINITVNPQRTTGNLIAGFTTNIIISFTLSNQSLQSYYTNNNAHIDITCSNPAILSLSRGCTVLSITNPLFQFYCEISASTIVIQNRKYGSSFSTTGLIQVIVGITNPSAAIIFTLKGYEYYISSTNYGLSFTGTGTYTPIAYPNMQFIKMYPFYTKKYSSTLAPIRFGLKTATSSVSYPSYYFAVSGLAVLSQSLNYQCLFRRFETAPVSNQQIIFVNSYRNYKQRTQHIDLNVYCYANAFGLLVQVPRNQGLSSSYYYELVIMPVNSGITGFTNQADSMFRVIAHPWAEERIDQIYKYVPSSFTLDSIQIVTKRPQSPTALLIAFKINFNSAKIYPVHYVQIVFRDLAFTSIKPAYNTPGSYVPCTLSLLFLALPTRIQSSPNCIFQKLDIIHGTVIVRVTQIGNIAAGSYELTFDDFLLPDMINPPLEDSSPFTLCFRYHDFSINNRLQNCFDQIFIIDYATNAAPQQQDTGSLTIGDSTYGSTGVTGTITISSYPMASTNALNQKIMVRFNNGYAATTPPPLLLQGYAPLWLNPSINLYIYRQVAKTAGTPITFTLNGLINPQAYQMSLYTNGVPSIQLTFYDSYHPIKRFTYSQPIFSSFSLQSSQIYATSVLFLDDIKQSVPYDTLFIYRMQLAVLDSPSVITTKQIDRVIVEFTSGVSKVQQCWIDTSQPGQPFQLDGQCSVASSTSVLLSKFDTAFNSNNLTLYLQFRVSTSTMSYKTTVYCKNGQKQYELASTQSFHDVNASSSSYPLLDFTESLYTPNYYELSTQITRATPHKYLYLSLYLPADFTHSITVFTITLPLTILPFNASTQKRMVCQWLTTDRYGRKYWTGQQSVCAFSLPNIITVQSPYGGLRRLSSTNTVIPYLLKIRQFFVVSTKFTTPTTSVCEQIILTHTTASTILQDTLVVYPYLSFQSGKLTVNTFTLTASELNTYDITFTPQTTVSIGKQAILQISLDSRYMPNYLGLDSLYQAYGLDSSNSSWINSLGLNVGYTLLPNKWVNGIPYSGYTSTSANAQQTCIFKEPQRYRISLLLQSSFVAGVSYNWKIPLLMNPTSPDLTFRMNVTLFTFWSGTSRYQKELFYEIINPFKTVTNISQTFNYTFAPTALLNTIQSTSASIDVSFGFPFIPNVTTVAQLKISYRGAALIGLANFYTKTYSDLSFSFFFFKRINSILAIKTIDNNSPIINFGSLEATNNFVDYFGYDWVKIHSSVDKKTLYNAGSLFQPLISCSILTITPTVVEGISYSTGSEFLQQFSFVTPCLIQNNSTLSISYSGVLFQWGKESPCYTSFKSIGCVYNSNGSLSIDFNQNVAVGATITFAIYLKALQPDSDIANLTLTGSIYALPQNPNTIINSIPTLTTLPAIVASPLQNGNIEDILILPLYQNTYMPLYGKLVPHYLPLTYIKIVHPFTWTPNSHHRFLYRLNTSLLLNQTQSLSWIQANQTLSAANLQKFELIPNSLIDYSLLSNLQYTFLMSSTYDPLKLNNFSIGAVGSYYNFIYQSQTQISYQQVYPVPVADLLTIYSPVLQINEPNALGFKFKMMAHSIKVGDTIDVYLDSHNLIKNMYQFTTTPIECAQGIQGILTASLTLICQVWQYPQNKEPMIIRVYPKKAVLANTPIQIWISPIINPQAVMVCGAIVKVSVDCNGEQRCQIYEARGYYKTVSNLALINNTLGATFTPSNTQVQKIGIDHTFVFNTQTATAAIMNYPENYDDFMSASCTYIGGKCIIFPVQKRIVVIPSSFVPISLMTLSAVNNGIYSRPKSEYINLTIISSSSLQFYNVNHTSLTTRKNNYVKGLLNSMTITPTQTPNLFLRNYMNTAIITLSGLFTDRFVKAFYIVAPSDVTTWDSTYCNATMATGVKDPYPVRLNCSKISATVLSIAIPEGVWYQFSFTDGYLMTINCKFYIVDFPAGQDTLYVSGPVLSGNFYAYGSYSADTSNPYYYITQASNNILISQHKIPQIGQIQFVEEPYSQRLANVNDKVYFDLLIDPVTTEPISTIEIQLPKQFGYPPVGNHDDCSMIARTTVPIQSCVQVRKDDYTYVIVTPYAGYKNGPVIISISNQNYSNWFTAPSLSGSWYNYTVSTYGANGTLLERQYSENCSNIGGLQLFIPNMSINNGQDSLMEEMVDINFMIGQQAVRQGYSEGLQTDSYYTNIKITFENWAAFNNELGNKFDDRQLIGCVTLGLTSKRQIQCLLVGGGDIEHQPYVLISGYERVPPYTNISISLPNILMLDSNNRNVLWVSVQLFKVGSWKQSYLYNPESLILKPTTSLALLPLVSLDLGFAGINTVSKNTTFYVSFTPSADITTYIIVKLPTGFTNRNISAFPYTCAQGTVQIFHRSDLIRIYPLNGVHTAGVTINYTIYNFPSTSYVINQQNYPIIFQAYSSYKQIHRQTFNLMFQSYPCTVNFGLISMSSPYSYDSNVKYVFEVEMTTLQSSVDRSTLSLILPQEYASLFSFGVKCQVEAPLQCTIMTEKMVVVRHLQLTNSTRILIALLGVANPSSSSHKFTVQTYNGDNLDQVICRSSINISTREAVVQACKTNVNVSHATTNNQATYRFTIICPQTLRNNSDVKIKISNDYIKNNKLGTLNCWSDRPKNLIENHCELLYANATLYVWFKNIVVWLNEANIGLNVILNNTIFGKNYSFESYIELYGNRYGTSNQAYMQFISSTVGKINFINLYNVPAAGGSSSIYILKLPNKYISNAVEIDFPQYYDIGSSISASFYSTNNSNWLQPLSYFDLLQYTYQSQLTSSVLRSSLGRYTISANNIQTANSTNWFYLLLKFIKNPSYYDSTYQFGVRCINIYKQLQYVYEGPFFIPINVPSGSIHMIDLKTGDDDLSMLTVHNITYQVDQPIYTNTTSFVITPPQPSRLEALQTLQCCFILNYTQIIECHSCRIGQEEIQFQINTQGLLLLSDQVFTLQLTSLYTPDSLNQCNTYEDYSRSYFSLMVFRNRTTLTHESIAPSKDLFTPCQTYTPLRGDILFNPPSVLYAGLAYEVALSITRPSKMLRAFIKSPNFDLQFSPNKVYFNSYDIQTIKIHILVNPNSKAQFSSIKISHEQSIVYNIFRDNLPVKVQIRTDTKQYVIVQQLQYFSVGNYISVPVVLTKIASYDIYLSFTLPDGASQLFQFEQNPILIPALSEKAHFNFRYKGDIVPQTLNVSMVLQSPNTLKHSLKPPVIYFFFSTTQQFQTLPPVMKLSIMHNYISNSYFRTKKVYNTNTNTILYDQLKPYIIQHKDVAIGATKASIIIFTRHQAEVYYILRERGSPLVNATPFSIRSSKQAKTSLTARNNSHYVNAYTIVNFTRLQHQTMYQVYAMAHDSLGDSNQFIIHRFMTKHLPNAVQLRIDTSSIIRDSVYLVHAISQILNIDIVRVKDVDSYIIQDNVWTKNTSSKNQLFYRNLIVISPSLVEDTPLPLDLVTSQLINNKANRLKLKKILPQFIDNFDQRMSTKRTQQQPLIQLIIHLPKIRSKPNVTKISYYNISFTYELWSEAIIYAIAIEKYKVGAMSLYEMHRTKVLYGAQINHLTDQIPYSRQIMLGRNSYNQNGSTASHNRTDNEGKGMIRVSNLKPGTKYDIFVTFTTKQKFEPILYGKTEQIMRLQVTTPENPNIKDNDEALRLQEIKKINKQMYEIIKDHKSKINNIDKLK